VNCFIHSDREAVGTCSKCGHPICQQCLNKMGGRMFCDTCAKDPRTLAELAGGAAALGGAVKNSGVAAVLSFLWVGLGQIYNGELAKGILLMVVYVFSWLMMFVIIGFFTTPVLWVWGIYDAYTTAERINRKA
jgi:TM2 domain-containing membrane protein YozV